MFNILNKLNFIWQNFIEDMFGMGNFLVPLTSVNLIKIK